MDRPTKEDLDAIRAMHKWEGGQEGFSKTSAWCRMGAVLAEVDALTEEQDAVGAGYATLSFERDASIARAETAERERDEAQAALVRLRAKAFEVAQSCPSFDEFDDPEERGSSIDAMTALHKALAATPADLAEAQRSEWMAATLDEVVALMREQQKEERDDKGWSALDTVACDLEERAANLRGGK